MTISLNWQKVVDPFLFGLVFAFGFGFGNWLIAKVPWPAI